MKYTVMRIVVMIFMLILCQYSARAQGSLRCLKFDGIDEYLETNTQLTLNLTTGFTVEAWIFIQSYQTSSNFYYSGIVNHYHTSENTETAFRLGIATNSTWENYRKIYCEIRKWDTGGMYIVTPEVLETQKWHHISVSYDGTTFRSYVNGVMTNSVDNVISGTYTMPIDIGRNSRGDESPSVFFSGMIDEVRVWSTSVDQNVIQHWMCKSVDASHPNWQNLEGYWRLDSDNGIICQDYSNNGLNCTMYNAEPDHDRVWSGAPIGDDAHFEIGLSASISLLDGLDLVVAPSDAVEGTVLFASRTNDYAQNTGTLPPVGIEYLVPRFWDVNLLNCTIASIEFYWTGLPEVNSDSTIYLLRRNNGADSVFVDVTSYAILNEESRCFVIIEPDSSVYQYTIGTGWAPPSNPDNVAIEVQESDAILTWSSVTENIFGHPITVDFYLIYYSNHAYEPAAYLFHGYTSDTTYVHAGVAAFSNFMYYRVESYDGSVGSLLSYIREGTSSNQSTGLSN